MLSTGSMSVGVPVNYCGVAKKYINIIKCMCLKNLLICLYIANYYYDLYGSLSYQ